MKSKRAIITVELVDQSLDVADEEILRDFSEWFRENAGLIPWVKDLKDLAIKTVPC